MPLKAGDRIGGYEVVSLLGAGGMGEVYRARDARLGRDVAIKILSPDIAADADGLMRFEREARMLASLNHPNIAAIYGVEDGAGHPALILELVDGETLANRIARGPIAIAEALAHARQMADALDTAHEAGIVHRDLKPANIKITEAGTIKVLDFGLAKAIAAASSPAAADPAQSPTITVHGTRDGVILGTVAYMSPEQARGKPLDKRTDIWAFGCVLFEMLTGRSTFSGETTSDVIAAIIERSPDWSKLPASTPAHVRRVLERCLEKDPKRRARDIADVRIELDAVAVASAPRWRWLPLAAAALTITALIAMSTIAWRGWSSPGAPTLALAMLPEAGTMLVTDAAKVSPDGRRIAFIARDRDGIRAVWVRAFDATRATRLDGTEGATGKLVWSPDSTQIGFLADGKLRRIPAAGGPAIAIASIAANLGVAWNRNGDIIFPLVNRTALFRVAASGGTPEPLTTLDPTRENSHRWPHFLPDGDHFLFTARSDVRENNLIYVGSLRDKTIKPLRPAQSDAVYAPPGYLMFVERGAIIAQRFNATTLALDGEPMLVASPVRHNTPSSDGFLSVSADGSVLVYGLGEPPLSYPMWFDRTGAHVGTVGPARPYAEVRLAPGGQTAAVDIADRDSGTRELWLLDIVTAVLTRLTSNPATDWNAVWSRDGSQIAFASDRAGISSVFRKRVDGGDDDVLVYRGSRGAFPNDWSPDDRTILVHVDRTGAGAILAVSVDNGSASPIVESKTSFLSAAALSPDGRWIAYESRETGQTEIYVSPSGRPGRVRVSTAGGTEPEWSADGRQLYYASPLGELMAARITPGAPLAAAPPAKLFSFCQSTTPPTVRVVPAFFNASRDGLRFLVKCAALDEQSEAIGVLRDWRAKLR